METTTDHKNVLLLGALALILGLLHNILFIGEMIGANVFYYVLAILCAGFVLTRTFKKQIDKPTLMLIIPLFFFSSMVFFRSSELLTFFNVLMCIGLLLIIVGSFAERPILKYLPLDYVKVAFMPLRFIAPFFETFPEIIALRKLRSAHPVLREIVRGALFALPALLFFGWLLASADQIFQKLVNNLFSFSFDEETFARLFKIAFVAAFFVGMFGFMFKRIHPAPAPRASRLRTFGAVEVMVFLGSIGALFLAFIIIQFTYLFGGEAHLIAQGFTYAEYARSGFVQLIWVAILACALIVLLERKIAQKDTQHLISFKILSGIVVAEVVCILASAFTRLSLYEHAYGFTTIRLYSYAFMIWLALFLTILFVHIVNGGAQEKFALRGFVSVLVLLFAMNLLNPDAFIAARNITRYHETGKIDTNYLARLSDDAIPVTIVLLSDGKESVRRDFASDLYWTRMLSMLHGTLNWKSSRYAAFGADRMVIPHQRYLEESNNLGLGGGGDI